MRKLQREVDPQYLNCPIRNVIDKFGDKWSHSFLGLPQIWNLWEEEEAQPLHLLQSNLIMDCRFRRSRAVWFFLRLFRPKQSFECNEIRNNRSNAMR